jgi:hypothetical protein
MDFRKSERPLRRKRRVKVTFPHGPCFTVDVGGGGFCSESLRVLAPGTPVEGTFQLKEGGQVRFEGHVVWARAGDARVNIRGRMGIRFTRVGPGLADLMQG